MPTDQKEKFSFDSHVGKKLRNKRVQLKRTQTDVAKSTNKTFQQVQKYEKGKNVINNIKLERIRKALCIPEHRMGFLTNKYNRRYKPVWKINEKTSI